MKNNVNLTEFGISPQAQYACYAMSTGVSSDLKAPVMIEPGILALFGTPFKHDDSWTQSLGTFHDESLKEANLLLIAFDDKAAEPQLARTLGMIWYALLLQGRAYSVDGIKMGGHNTPNGLHVSAVGTLDDFYRPPAMPIWVDNDSLNKCVGVARGIATIFGRQDDDQHYLRLRKGFNAWLSALKEGTYCDARLHQLVRAVEALMKPEIGNTRRQFAHRGQLFAGRGSADRALLNQLFNMRSATEHMNSLRDLLGDPKGERDKLIELRVLQAEMLAGHIYRRLLTDAKLLAQFQTDDDISAFWKRPIDELANVWGPPIDLGRSVEREFGFLCRKDLS